MLNSIKKLVLILGVIMTPWYVFAEDVVEEIEDTEAAEAISNYDVSGSLFEQITNLEQDKILMQLEKERAQLDLELNRLNAEKIKIQMELDTLSGRAEQQQKELEVAKAELENQSKQLEQQKARLEEEAENPRVEQHVQKQPTQPKSTIGEKYKLVNIVGVGNQLQATLEDTSNGQNKRVFVGRLIDDYLIKSISLDDGIVFEKDGVEETLNIGK